VEDRPIPELEDGQVVVEVAVFSLDPTHRGWAATDTYMPAVSTAQSQHSTVTAAFRRSSRSLPSLPVSLPQL
jgi:NADPH-dependent curcumin reductase CurA